jgi:hypothetical protein
VPACRSRLDVIECKPKGQGCAFNGDPVLTGAPAKIAAIAVSIENDCAPQTMPESWLTRSLSVAPCRESTIAQKSRQMLLGQISWPLWKLPAFTVELASESLEHERRRWALPVRSRSSKARLRLERREAPEESVP